MDYCTTADCLALCGLIRLSSTAFLLSVEVYLCAVVSLPADIYFSAAGFAAWVKDFYSPLNYGTLMYLGFILIHHLKALHESMELITLLFHGVFQVLEQLGMATAFPVQQVLQVLDSTL